LKKKYVLAELQIKNLLIMLHETGVYTNTIEGNQRSLKASIPDRCRIKRPVPLFLSRYMTIRNKTELPLKFLIKY